MEALITNNFVQNQTQELNARHKHKPTGQRSRQQMLTHPPVQDWRSRAAALLPTEPQRQRRGCFRGVGQKETSDRQARRPQH